MALHAKQIAFELGQLVNGIQHSVQNIRKRQRANFFAAHVGAFERQPLARSRHVHSCPISDN